MSRGDFERCTPLEFDAVVAAHQKRETLLYQDGWERVRAAALFILSPYSKRALKLEEVMKFDWDKSAHSSKEDMNVNREAAYEAAKKRYGCE